VNSITIENNRKTYNVKSYRRFGSAGWYEKKWYEGVGSNEGVLLSLITSFSIGHYQDCRLNCFKHNDTVKYFNNPYCNTCFCTANSITTYDFSGNIHIFPNPTQDMIYIEMPDNIAIKSISIYSLDGKLIKRNRYSFISTQLNIANLKSGSYILNIETDTGNYKQIIIKN
jgi:hypothetical protein